MIGAMFGRISRVSSEGVDSPRASARMSAQSLCIQIQQKTGIDTILHYTCRDRNVLSIQSDLLGASSIGLKNILCLTGDPPKLGNYPDATAEMVWPRQARALLAAAGFQPLRTDFLFVFPHALRALRRLEPALRRFPFGAQYLVLSRRA